MTMRFRTTLLGALAALLTAGSATAGLLPATVTVLPQGNNFRWTYSIVLPTDSQLIHGDYFTIYDFGGLVANGNSEPKDWNYAESLTGPLTPGVMPNDNPNIMNLTWTYTGPTIPSGQIGLGNFWAVSEFETVGTANFTARTHRTSDGRIDTNITDTSVPVPSGPGDPQTVPEPATLLLAGLGLPLVGLARRLRRG